MIYVAYTLVVAMFLTAAVYLFTHDHGTAAAFCLLGALCLSTGTRKDPE